MDKEFKKRLANDRRKWGAVVLMNAALLLVFPQRNSVIDILPVQSVLRSVQQSKKIVTPIIVRKIEEEPGNFE